MGPKKWRAILTQIMLVYIYQKSNFSVDNKLVENLFKEAQTMILGSIVIYFYFLFGLIGRKEKRKEKEKSKEREKKRRLFALHYRHVCARSAREIF